MRNRQGEKLGENHSFSRDHYNYIPYMALSKRQMIQISLFEGGVELRMQITAEMLQ